MRTLTLTAWFTVITAAAALFCLPVIAQDPPPAAQIYVSVLPEGASVTCDGKPATSPPPVTIQGLEAGEHLVIVEKMGFEPERRTVVLEAGQRANVEFQLSPTLGLLLVHSNPSGADVEIDGAYRGKTPLLVSDLPLGQYRVRLNLAGYLPKEIELPLNTRTPKKVQLDLKSNSARLTIDSEPSGARVIVNGVARGTAPCIVDRIPEGNSSVELLLTGYKPHKQDVKLSAGEEQTINVVLVSIPAKLTVVSIPAGARIYVNNEFRGKSPITLEELEPGTYRIRGERPGHEPMGRTVELSRGQSLVEELRLTGNTGMMEIMTEPAGATVFVDGEPAGTTVAKPGETDRVSEALRIEEITEGQHEVQVTLKGFFGERFSIFVERSKTVSIHKQLKKRFIPDCEVVTKSGVHRGVLLGVSPDGNVKLELNPGVVRTIPADEIRFRRPIREPDE